MTHPFPENFKDSGQRGSAIIMLFIAVALFALLAIVFLQGSRSNVTMLSDEQAKAYATQIVEYADNVRMAVKRLSLRGCKDTEISMENNSGHYANAAAPSDKSCHVFNTAGGAINADLVPQSWISTARTEWQPWFNSEMAVEEIGTSQAELVLWINSLKPEICSKINQRIGMPATSPESLSLPSGLSFDGTYPAFDTIGDVPASPYKGKQYACWDNSLFFVLLAR